MRMEAEAAQRRESSTAKHEAASRQALMKAREEGREEARAEGAAALQHAVEQAVTDARETLEAEGTARVQAAEEAARETAKQVRRKHIRELAEARREARKESKEEVSPSLSAAVSETPPVSHAMGDGTSVVEQDLILAKLRIAELSQQIEEQRHQVKQDNRLSNSMETVRAISSWRGRAANGSAAVAHTQRDEQPQRWTSDAPPPPPPLPASSPFTSIYSAEEAVQQTSC